MSATKPKANAKSIPEATPSFEQAYAELESIVTQMESGQMPLEASLTAYQRGNALLQSCQKSLADVEQQVQILNNSNRLTPFLPQED